MNVGILIKRIVRDCPFCNYKHSIEVRKRSTNAIVRGEIVEYDEIYYRCPYHEEEFIPMGILDENLLRARDAYRRKKQLLMSEEIKRIRESRCLTQGEFSKLLWWKEGKIAALETKEIQSIGEDRVLRMFDRVHN